MRNVFVETSNVRRFHGALSALDQRGAQEACLIVVDGLPGLGKTTTLKHWVAQNSAVYLRAKKEWTAAWFMNEVLEGLRVDSPRGIEKKYSKILEEMSQRQNTAALERRAFGLVIDEADHISAKPSILETIRDVSDMIELPTILVGMGKVNEHLKRFPQVTSRVSQKVRFESLTKEDVKKLIEARCEIKVANDLTDFVLTVTQGFNREMLEAIANIERFGLRFDVGAAGVTMRDMVGQIIINDRRTGKPVHVPGEL